MEAACEGGSLMTKLRTYCLGFAMLSLVGACGPKPIPADQQAQLQDLLEKELVKLKAPGMIIAAQVGDGEPWIGVAGVEQEGSTSRVVPESIFRVGSITKNFVGTVILEMVDEGKISLDDTLEQWIPGAIAGVDGTKITIRNLLQHTSGIESYTTDPWLIEVYLDPQHVWNAPSELLALAAGARKDDVAMGAVSPVGTYDYSNTGFILLGMIAAKISGYEMNEYDRVLRERLFTPLNMQATSVPAIGDASMAGSTNHGVVNWVNFIGSLSDCQSVNPSCMNVDTDFTIQEMTNAWSAGSIRSTAGDLLKYLSKELRGNLLKPDTLAQRETFLDPGRSDGVTVGLALFRQPTYGIIGHIGQVFGFDATMQYFPDQDLTMVVMANHTALDFVHVRTVPEDMIALLYPQTPVLFTPKASALSVSQPAAHRSQLRGHLNEY